MVAIVGQSRRQVAAQALAAIHVAAGGILKSEDVVERASDVAHVLHDRFEWDDAKAGHAYRLEQADALIREVRIEITEYLVPLRAVAYVPDPETPQNEPGYRSVLELRNSASASEAAFENELERVRALVRRAREIGFALGLGEEVDRRLKELL
jgi:hypothetical protein